MRRLMSTQNGDVLLELRLKDYMKTMQRVSTKIELVSNILRPRKKGEAAYL
jgi:hypothetical protein